jgi:hypothetical protein
MQIKKEEKAEIETERYSMVRKREREREREEMQSCDRRLQNVILTWFLVLTSSHAHALAQGKVNPSCK